MPKTTGTIAEMPAIGATMLIAPTAMRAVVRVQPERSRERGRNREQRRRVCRPFAAYRDDHGDAEQPAELHVHEHAQRTERSALERPEEVREPPRQARAQRENNRLHQKTLASR